MKPINKKERNKAIGKVVGLFLFSFFIAVILGFTTMNVGKLSEKSVNTELKKLKSDLSFLEQTFAPNVEKTTEMLYKIPTYKETGENLEILNQDIGALLSRTKNQISDADTWDVNMYKNVIQALSNLQIAYNDQLKLHDQMGSAGDLEQRYQASLLEKDRLQTQLNMLQAAASAAGAGGGGGGGGAAAAAAAVADCSKIEKELAAVKQQLNTCNLENRALKQEVERIRNR